VATPAEDRKHRPQNKAMLLLVMTNTGQQTNASGLDLGCLHPVACVRSDDVGFIRLRNVNLLLIYYIATCFGRTTVSNKLTYDSDVA
jgi:hypothetical protein